MTETKEEPKQIGRYEIRGQLGRGGMGDVYRVWDPVTRREVALKVLKFSYPRALHYFKREFRAVASLSHPNLVTLYDLHGEEGVYFYTMELIEGMDLYVHINGHNRIVSDPRVLSAHARLDRVRRTVIQLLRGLAFLHEHGRVHRDIKPSNILVDTEDRVKLVDFGIVRELIPGGEGQSLSQVFGTSTYFSPEQSLGSHVGPASDLYSVGVVLYELLTGTPPFEGESADVARMHRTKAATPIVRKVPSVPRDLIRVCEALMAKQEGNRPSARQALEMLRADADLGFPQAEFIGRFSARRRLHDALKASQAGKNQLVVIQGESGVGKTALMETFGQEARLFGASLFIGTCVQRDHVPMRGLDTLVERLAEAYRRETARVLRRLTEGQRGALIQAFGFLGELLPSNEHGDPDAGFDPATGLQAMLCALASKRSLILVLEHLHLADDSVCDVLEKVLSGNAPPPALFIATVRHDEVDPNTRVSSFLEFTASLQNMQTIELDPFTVEETREFVQQHLDPPPLWLARQIHDECGGVPLFVSEMVDHIGRTMPRSSPTLRDSVHHRISSLDSTDRAVLTTLALSPLPLLIPTITEACGFNTEAVYAALQRLGRARLAELATTPDGSAIALPCHDRLLKVFRAELKAPETADWHRELALAHQKTRGPGVVIEEHWAGSGDPTKALEYADIEASRALADGDHSRVAEMVRLALRQEQSTEERIRHTIQLSDSLTRTGRFHEAARILETLEDLDAETAQRWRGRRCQLYLMAGDLNRFETSVGPLPRRARVPLADLLAPYQPQRAESLLSESDDKWAELVTIRLASQCNDDRKIQGSRKALEICLSEHKEDSPEWNTAVSLTEAMILKALGDLDGAQRKLDSGLSALEPDPGQLMWTRLRLARARCALSRGLITQARSAARTLLLEARERDLPGLQVAACDLLAQVHLIAGEPNAAIPLVQEAMTRWQDQSASTVAVRLSLLEATLSFYTESHVSAAAKLETLANRSELDALTALRPQYLEIAILGSRITCMHLLSAWCLDKEIPEEILSESRRSLTLARPRPGWWLGIQSSVFALVSGAPDEAIDIIQELIERSTAVNRVAEALAWGLLARCQDEVRKGSTRSRNQAKSILDEIGAAPPPELMLLQAGKKPNSAL